MFRPDPGDLLDPPTQAYLRQLAQVVDQPAPPEVMARRRRALHAMVEVMLPGSRTILGVERPVSEAEFMALVRAMATRAGMSYNAIAKATEDTAGLEAVPKSTVHDVLSRDRLPRREGQLRALLAVLVKANHGNGEDLQALLDLRAHLLSTRAAPAAPPALCPGCQWRRDPPAGRGGPVIGDAVHRPGSPVTGSERTVVLRRPGVITYVPDTEPVRRPGTRTPHMGLQVDIVDYGRRREDDREDLEERMRTLMREMFVRAGLQYAGLTHVGDGMRVILTPQTDPAEALNAVLTTTARALADDNQRYRDRMRLRMALDFGLARHTEHGLIGNLVIDLRRLIDSAAIRGAVADHPEWDLVALVSNRLCELVKPEQLSFEQIDVVAKEYAAQAWLWQPGEA
jgi:hypothetical protein